MSKNQYGDYTITSTHPIPAQSSPVQSSPVFQQYTTIVIILWQHIVETKMMYFNYFLIFLIGFYFYICKIINKFIIPATN